MPVAVYLCASISIVFTTALFGLLINNTINSKDFYIRLTNMNFIRNEAINKYLGVKALKHLIVNTFWSKLNPSLQIPNTRNKEQLLKIRTEMTNAEISHLIGFLITLLLMLISYVTSWHTGIILPLLISNIAFHLHPALLQQYNKRRLDKLLKML